MHSGARLVRDEAVQGPVYSDNVVWGRKTVKYSRTVGNDDNRCPRRSYRWKWQHRDLENTKDQHRSCYC